mmetsp:Transcript_20104/g.41660  ORF Transcript_20104/g.41660 Transcript_20104/m.41660 type:complete len:306 (-) Transcript_20104:28-945(-)
MQCNTQSTVAAWLARACLLRWFVVGDGTDVLLQPGPDGDSTGSTPCHKRRFACRDEDKGRCPVPGFLPVARAFPQPHAFPEKARNILRHPPGSQEDVVDVDHHLPSLGIQLVRAQQRQQDQVFVDPDTVPKVFLVQHCKGKNRHGLEGSEFSSPRRQHQLPRTVGSLPQLFLRFLVGIDVPGVSIDDADRIVETVARGTGFRGDVDPCHSVSVFVAGYRNDGFFRLLIRCRAAGGGAAAAASRKAVANPGAEPEGQQQNNREMMILHSVYYLFSGGCFQVRCYNRNYEVKLRHVVWPSKSRSSTT